jgi:hypothetical protein
MKRILVLGALGTAILALLVGALGAAYPWNGSVTSSFQAETGSWESGPSDLSCRILTFFQAELRWSPADSPVDGYRIYHKGLWPRGGDFSLLAQIPDVSITSYDGVAPSLLRHSYYMTSYFDSWESPPTETISVYCRPRIFFPGPCELEGENHHSQRGVELAWDPVAGAVSYGVLRSTVSGGPYELLATTDVPALSDTAVSDGATYYYVIVAVDAAGNESDPSGELVIEDTAPPEPTPTPENASDPTSTPTPTPAAAPTLEPTSTTEPAATPSPTPTVTFTPTPMLTSTPTPTPT